MAQRLQKRDLEQLAEISSLLSGLGLINGVRTWSESEAGHGQLESLKKSLIRLENQILTLDSESLVEIQSDLKPLAEMGQLISVIALHEMEFVQFMRLLLGESLAKTLFEILQGALRMNAKIDAILTDPNPDEDSAEYHKFLAGFAEMLDGKGKATKPSFSPRESLGI